MELDEFYLQNLAVMFDVCILIKLLYASSYVVLL